MHAIFEKHSASDNYLQCQHKIEIEKTIYQSERAIRLKCTNHCLPRIACHYLRIIQVALSNRCGLELAT